MRRGRATCVLALAAAAIGAASAIAESSRDDWSDENCTEKAQARWCAPTLRGRGWVLKYRSENPKDLPDVFWQIEVWVKGADALICELKGGRGGIRSNGCYSAIDVTAKR